MRLAVIGVGLIGGSFALALKQARRVAHVVGVGRSKSNLELAQRRGILDSVATDAASAATDADLVFVAAPVAQFDAIFRALAPALKANALVTDGGSTKRDVIAAARRGLGPKIGQFVPGHPIAGAEQSGASAASADLFRGRRVVITPLPENRPESVRRIEEHWEACGARLTRLDPERHDAVLAAVSHLPHALAYALVHDIARREGAEELFAYAAGGFRDFTRIASSHPEMWRDICIANRDHLLEELTRYGAALADLQRLLDARDAEGLEKLFAEARDARNRWLKSSS